MPESFFLQKAPALFSSYLLFTRSLVEPRQGVKTPGAQSSPAPPRGCTARPPELRGSGRAHVLGKPVPPGSGPPPIPSPSFSALRLAEQGPRIGLGLGYPAPGVRGDAAGGRARRPTRMEIFVGASRLAAHRAAEGFYRLSGVRRRPAHPTPKWLFAAFLNSRPSPSAHLPRRPGAQRAGLSPPGPWLPAGTLTARSGAQTLRPGQATRGDPLTTGALDREPRGRRPTVPWSLAAPPRPRPPTPGLSSGTWSGRGRWESEDAARRRKEAGTLPSLWLPLGRRRLYLTAAAPRGHATWADSLAAPPRPMSVGAAPRDPARRRQWGDAARRRRAPGLCTGSRQRGRRRAGAARASGGRRGGASTLPPNFRSPPPWAGVRNRPGRTRTRLLHSRSSGGHVCTARD